MGHRQCGFSWNHHPDSATVRGQRKPWNQERHVPHWLHCPGRDAWFRHDGLVDGGNIESMSMCDIFAQVEARLGGALSTPAKATVRECVQKKVKNKGAANLASRVTMNVPKVITASGKQLRLKRLRATALEVVHGGNMESMSMRDIFTQVEARLGVTLDTPAKAEVRECVQERIQKQHAASRGLRRGSFK